MVLGDVGAGRVLARRRRRRPAHRRPHLPTAQYVRMAWSGCSSSWPSRACSTSASPRCPAARRAGRRTVRVVGRAELRRRGRHPELPLRLPAPGPARRPGPAPGRGGGCRTALRSGRGARRRGRHRHHVVPPALEAALPALPAVAGAVALAVLAGLLLVGTRGLNTAFERTAPGLVAASERYFALAGPQDAVATTLEGTGLAPRFPIASPRERFLDVDACLSDGFTACSGDDPPAFVLLSSEQEAVGELQQGRAPGVVVAVRRPARRHRGVPRGGPLGRRDPAPAQRLTGHGPPRSLDHQSTRRPSPSRGTPEAPCTTSSNRSSTARSPRGSRTGPRGP